MHCIGSCNPASEILTIYKFVSLWQSELDASLHIDTKDGDSHVISLGPLVLGAGKGELQLEVLRLKRQRINPSIKKQLLLSKLQMQTGNYLKKMDPSNKWKKLTRMCQKLKATPNQPRLLMLLQVLQTPSWMEIGTCFKIV